uniref:Protein kinase domain-containing protein n=1 Tax=Amphimedon queenslandica TaxID=400682 RepID=A0A1X7U4D0_AMPQE
MENYVLYGEISSKPWCTVFKGRRKRTVEYVSIHKYSTELYETLSHNVNQLSHLDHTHILQFLEWYRSPQHIWLVTELASVGTLADLMSADGPVPLESIPSFVSDILSGLNHAHLMGVVIRDLCPAKIYLDACGNLKLSDFSLAIDLKKNKDDDDNINVMKDIEQFYSSIININEKLLVQNNDADSTKSVDIPGVNSLTQQHSIQPPSNHKDSAHSPLLALNAHHFSSPSLPSPFYLSPESIEHSLFSIGTDLWSIGVIMYELWTGKCPFSGDTHTDLVHSIISYEPVEIKEWRESNSTSNTSSSNSTGLEDHLLCVSYQVMKLMCGLLVKDPSKRHGWNDVIPIEGLWNKK